MIDRPSPNYDTRKNNVPPSMIILHYTGMEDADAALNRLCDPESKVSAHYTIDEDGALYHHVDEENRAWHAGASYWRGKTDINSHSIGIEIVNKGHEHGYTPFPDAQIDTVIALCRDIQTRHDIDHVLAHSDIAPDRKQDPGELFPWQKLARDGVGIWPAESDEARIKSGSMDIATALRDFGYQATKSNNMLIAFQRHFVPEAFDNKTQGTACHLTKTRLYALLANHIIKRT